MPDFASLLASGLAGAVFTKVWDHFRRERRRLCFTLHRFLVVSGPIEGLEVHFHSRLVQNAWVEYVQLRNSGNRSLSALPIHIESAGGQLEVLLHKAPPGALLTVRAQGDSQIEVCCSLLHPRETCEVWLIVLDATDGCLAIRSNAADVQCRPYLVIEHGAVLHDARPLVDRVRARFPRKETR